MSRMIPYGRQSISPDDAMQVVEAMQEDYLTTGPKVALFEAEFAKYVGADHAVAVSSGTAALHCALAALGIGSGDEVIVPALTFAATANAVVYCGGRPVFADVDPDTLCIDPDSVAQLHRTRGDVSAIVPVDYAGQPCDYGEINQKLGYRVSIVSDACHSLGSREGGEMTGSRADLTCFSFHPVKAMTTLGEGGMVVTNYESLAEKMRLLRNHGGAGSGDMRVLGWNYRLSDVACAMGLSQLAKLPRFLQRRREIAAAYAEAFAGMEHVRPLAIREGVEHAWHLYVLRVLPSLGKSRDQVRKELADRGVGTQVHYVPVHLHKWYRERYGTYEGMCPVAEQASREILSIPMYPGLSIADQQQVIEAVQEVCSGRR